MPPMTIRFKFSDGDTVYVLSEGRVAGRMKITGIELVGKTPKYRGSLKHLGCSKDWPGVGWYAPERLCFATLKEAEAAAARD